MVLRRISSLLITEMNEQVIEFSTRLRLVLIDIYHSTDTTVCACQYSEGDLGTSYRFFCFTRLRSVRPFFHQVRTFLSSHGAYLISASSEKVSARTHMWPIYCSFLPAYHSKTTLFTHPARSSCKIKLLASPLSSYRPRSQIQAWLLMQPPRRGTKPPI